ncbi:MAG: hypothetical protein LBB47_00630 [Spirochaetaceae bacterium]|nr:hypothetical protein [Spirochaetaceae bacterium]
MGSEIVESVGTVKVVESVGTVEVVEPAGTAEVVEPAGTVEVAEPAGTVEVAEPAGTVKTAVAPVQPEAAEFDPVSVTEEVYQEVKQDLFDFIQDLNSIIRARRYSVWAQHLDEDYYQYINSQDYLQELSKAEILATRKIVLENAYDYFMYVVVPSHSNDRVDEIEFVSENRIKAITINKGVRVILYDFEKTQNGWKIVKPNLKR